MSMFRSAVLIGVLTTAATASTPAVSQEARSPHLGEGLTPAQAAELDFVVLPNGEGLPGGAGNAVTGEDLYRTHCLACHGERGENGSNDRLAGGRGSIGSTAPVKTVGSYWPYATTLFDYLRRAMPYQTPGRLTNDELYSLTAYVLYINEIVTQTEILDARSLPEVQMPNRDGFVWKLVRE
jgi:mono/diheme cytochrome c family protein